MSYSEFRFCQICGGYLQLQKDGSYICSKGHIKKGETYEYREREILKRNKQEKEVLENLIKNGILFRLMRPKKLRPPSFAQEAGMENINAQTHLFYEHLRKIERDYPLDIRYRRGNLIPLIIPYILCSRSKAKIIDSRIRSFKLYDNTNWWLKEVKFTEKEIRKLFT